MDTLSRLNKFIAANGVSSRRKIDELILQGRVTVNGSTVSELGFKIDPEADKVAVDGELIRTDTKKIYIILNKPPGVITSVSDEKKRTTVIDLIKINQKIFPVGRLDYNTSGLLLLTNDGGLANRLMSPKSKVYKTYYVELSKPLEEKHRIKLTAGIKIEGRLTAPSKIRFPKENDYLSMYISIYEGRNKQIHKMFESYGYFVRVLQRVEYAGIKLGGLAEGEWRKLTSDELTILNSPSKLITAELNDEIKTDKKPFRKVYKKYNIRDGKNSVRRDFKKSDEKSGKSVKHLSFNKKRDEERGLKLGFRKNAEDRGDYRMKDKKEHRHFEKHDFKKSGSSFDRKDMTGSFKKSDGADNRKDAKGNFGKYKKGDDRKNTKRAFRKSR